MRTHHELASRDEHHARRLDRWLRHHVSLGTEKSLDHAAGFIGTFFFVVSPLRMAPVVGRAL